MTPWTNPEYYHRGPWVAVWNPVGFLLVPCLDHGEHLEIVFPLCEGCSTALAASACWVNIARGEGYHYNCAPPGLTSN